MRLSRVNSRSVKNLQRGLASYLFQKANQIRKRNSGDYAEYLDTIRTLLSNRIRGIKK